MKTDKKKKGLGRGLDALFESTVSVIPPGKADKDFNAPENAIKHENSDEDTTSTENNIFYIDVNHIKPNAKQPRKYFDDEKIEELAESIKQYGVIQPIVLRKSQNYYEIVAGERRWRAARIAGLKEVPCIIRDFTDEENMLVAIIENMQREDLNPIEEAVGVETLIQTYGFTQEEVSKHISKSRPYITNLLRLLRLPDKIRDMLEEGIITQGHARALINIEDEKRQLYICNQILKKGLSVRDVEKLADVAKERPRDKKDKGTSGKSDEISAIERDLESLIGSKVSINEKSGKGNIKIDYYSTNELNHIIEMLKKINSISEDTCEAPDNH